MPLLYIPSAFANAMEYARNQNNLLNLKEICNTILVVGSFFLGTVAHPGICGWKKSPSLKAVFRRRGRKKYLRSCPVFRNTPIFCVLETTILNNRKQLHNNTFVVDSND